MRIIALFFVMSLLAGTLLPMGAARAEAPALPDGITYENPMNVFDIGDPFILPAEGRYYLFATGGTVGFNVWSSDDLQTFQDKQKALKALPWAMGDYWAPEVYAYDGKYVMLFSARWKDNGSLRVGIAFADHPAGPYEEPLGGPLFDLGYAVIDASLYVAEDGTPYMFYSRDCSEYVYNGRNESHIYGVQLTQDLLHFVGEPVPLIQPDTDWEHDGGTWRWNEGPSVLKHDGRYYLYYSANFYASREYAVGVAVADSPLGPYTKQANNPLLTWTGPDDSPTISGPGHNSFFKVGEQWFTAYHTHTYPQNPSGNRRLNIDSAGFHADGTAYLNGPFYGKRPLPDAVSGYENAAPTAQTNAVLLIDGDVGFGPSALDYLWRGSEAELTFAAPIAPHYVMVYPGADWRGSGTLTLGNETLMLTPDGVDPAYGAWVFPLNGTETDSLTLQLDGEGTLAEIAVYTKVE